MSYLQQYGNNSNFGSSSGSKRRRRSLSSSSSSPPARRHSSYKSQDHQLQPSRCLGVFGLESFTKEEKLREVFAKFGPIEYIKMVNFYQTQISRGFCFVYFENISDARRAKDSCNGMRIDGRRIRVDFSTRKRAHSPTPGVYRGQPICLWNGGNQERVLWSPNKKYNTTEPNRSIDRVNEKFEKI